ncbi:MAG: amidohydrolase [Candidatus Kapaibacterium sp.]|nr:MAG: amidohydrolase [Candidatus Kapabacteria bacterium]
MPLAIQGEITIVRGKIVSVEHRAGGVTLHFGNNRVEFPDAWATPGLVDAHAHVVGLGIAFAEGYLQSASSLEECLRRVAQYCYKRRGEWIIARGWNHEQWPNPRLPTRADLDGVFPDIPVALTRVDGHALWVNSRALERAGITASTPDPNGGAILRDKRGEPTGILLDAAMDAIYQALPPRTPTEIEQAIVSALTACSSVGLTEIHDMDVLPEDLPIFTRLAEEGKLRCRILSWVRGQHEEWHREGILPTTGEFHRVVGIKLFADGALGSRGAALSQPYADAPETYGLELLSTEQIVHRIERAIGDGFSSIAVHAIGDRAVSNVLDAFEQIRDRYPHSSDVRFRIEHSQVVRSEDIPRYVRTGAIASVQPIHCTSDAPMAERRLGERIRDAYRWRSFLDAGVLLCAGSDFPVESHNPILGIEAFVRRRPAGYTDAWNPSECIEAAEALEAYTINAHRAADLAYRRGTIASGMDADISIFDHNIETCPPEELPTIRTLATVVGGTLYEHA